MWFSTDLDCFHCSPLPEALCCPMNLCSFPVDVVVGGVGACTGVHFITLLESIAITWAGIAFLL